MGHRRCDICGESLPKGCKLYCPTCWEEYEPRYNRLYHQIARDKREPRQDKIAEMRAKYARIDIDQEIDNWIKEVIPDGV